jgi:SAM-dependent methyltransferase
MDVALCFSALDHCSDPDIVLTNVLRALRPGGRLILDLRNVAAWYKTIARRLPRAVQKKLKQDDDPHNWHFTPWILRERLERIGFCDLKATDIFYLRPFLGSPLVRWLPTALGPRLCRGGLRLIDAVCSIVLRHRGGNFIFSARRPDSATTAFEQCDQVARS